MSGSVATLPDYSVSGSKGELAERLVAMPAVNVQRHRDISGTT
jgi:hypothetical protein